ncbi:conserved hypothetical protein [Sinorhizobium medicae]|uniref:Uncharacterized protein n=1 Tax=Sinorhizobium medicae TaxID=110321 RepID=A0A508XAH8_9HYPH|nr:conserved hypothetical protein [Sinorhizobium medicae]
MNDGDLTWRPSAARLHREKQPVSGRFASCYLSILTAINATDAFWRNIRLEEIEVTSPLLYSP